MSGVLAGGFNLIMKGIGGIGTVLIRVATLAMAHPVIALIAAIAAGAIYIWQNWDTLGPKFFALIDTISSYFGNLKDRAIEAGRNMIDGMISGITSRWDSLKSTVGDIGDKSVDWVKDKLGIHSPSRVFAELGGYVMQGFEQGMSNGEGGPLAALMHQSTGSWLPVFGTAITLDVCAALLAILLLKPMRERYLQGQTRA